MSQTICIVRLTSPGKNLYPVISYSQGTNSEKGNRWVERIVSLRQTYRLRGKFSFAVLVEAMNCYFKEQKHDLEWIRSAA